MVAIDTSILIDLLGDDPRADAAVASLRDVLSRDVVVATEVVVSELIAGLGHGDEVVDTLEDMGIRFSPLELRSAVRAGEMQRRYSERMKAARLTPRSPRTVPDFLVGAHALLQCNALITRDAGFYRDYFKGLKVIVPKA
jgi:hypothetical protein